MITITSTKGMDANLQRYPLIPGYFPEIGLQERPYIFKKPVIFLTARSHPAETPSSVLIEALIEFLLNAGDT